MDDGANSNSQPVAVAQQQIHQSVGQLGAPSPPGPPAATSFDAKGPGPGTWIVAGLGLIIVWPGLIALVLAAISRSKAVAAEKVWQLGSAVEAAKLASTASGLRIAAILFSLVPLGFVVLAILAVTMLGTEATDSFSTIE